MTGLYGGQQMALTTNGGNLLAHAGANVVDYGQYGYHWHHGNWWPYATTIYVNGHRSCSCPNCAGDCCDCADCKVKRLEKRVADLEAAR